MHRRLLFICLALLTLAPTARAVESPVRLLSFQANGIGVYQTGRSSYSGQVAWIPSVGFGGLGLRGELGITLLKNALDESFFATNYEAFLTLPIIPSVLTLEGGGGLATWMGGNGGTNPILSGYVVLGIPGGIDRIFFAFSRYFLSGAESNQLKLGIGFSL